MVLVLARIGIPAGAMVPLQLTTPIFFFDTVGSTDAKSLKVVVDGDDDYANNNVRVMTKTQIQVICLMYQPVTHGMFPFILKEKLGMS